MFNTRCTFVAVTILSCFLSAQGASKYYTDENRPYEFGFNIEGEQHRHEKKDENGLIMGEFGFITADGVYHVTVYATDENGNFKILSMKNIRTKPYPTAPARKGNSLPFPPSSSHAGPVAQAPAQQTSQAGSVAQEPAAPVKSCSHCSVPTTTTAPSLTDIAQVSENQQYNPQNPNNPQYLQNSEQPQFPANQYPQNQQYPQNSQYPENPQFPQNELFPQNEQYPSQYSESPQNPQYPENLPGDYNQVPGQKLQPGERNPKQFDLPQYLQDGSVPSKPTLISAQMQIVDKNTDIYHLGPGEKNGLPNGLTKQDMKLLLYTFNYTVGFHGHHEEGYTDGSKVGYYFVTGRNGIRTRIDYVADENGFRPKISQEVLDLLSDDVPKEETEKDPKFGLKGYEFKWIYYPVESKR